jgi:hypothetical protein
MIITFTFLVLYTAVQPYCTPGLSKTQACSLIAQFVTLFAGMCLVVEFYIQKDLISAGEVDITNQSSEVFGSFIIGINLLVASWPTIMLLMSDDFEFYLGIISRLLKNFFHNAQPSTHHLEKQVTKKGEILSLVSRAMCCGDSRVHSASDSDMPQHLGSENSSGETVLNTPGLDIESGLALP